MSTRSVYAKFSKWKTKRIAWIIFVWSTAYWQQQSLRRKWIVHVLPGFCWRYVVWRPWTSWSHRIQLSIHNTDRLWAAGRYTIVSSLDVKLWHSDTLRQLRKRFMRLMLFCITVLSKVIWPTEFTTNTTQLFFFILRFKKIASWHALEY